MQTCVQKASGILSILPNVVIIWEKLTHFGKKELFLRQKPVELGRLIGLAKVQSTEASNRIEGTNDPKPFIKYILGIILECYRDFDNRVYIVHGAGAKSTSYDIVKETYAKLDPNLMGPNGLMSNKIIDCITK